MSKPLTELSTKVADGIKEVNKELENLSIFPENATKEKLLELHVKASKLIDAANFIVSSASSIEEANNMALKKLNNSKVFISDGVSYYNNRLK